MITRMGVLAILALTVVQPVVAQQKQESEEEKNARLARQGAGLRAGVWQVKELATGDESAPFVEGYFQRGLDLHLVMESSAGVWRNQQTLRRTGTLGGTTEEEISTYIVPLLTSIKFLPTKPGAAVEPFIIAGIGFALGIGESAGTGGLLASGGGTQMMTGFGAKGGAGVELKLGNAFGATVSGRYQWIKLQENLGSDDTYRGLGFEAGLRYRFQY
jgi:hypothetical protein